MRPIFFVPALLGVASVLQAGLNKRIAASIGLGRTLLINGVVLLVMAGVLYVAVRAFPRVLPEELSAHAGGKLSPALFWLVPGVCGFFLVLGIPVAMERMGAAVVYVLLVGTQM